MKTYQQVGFGLQQINQHSDHVCECCKGFDHSASEFTPDDLVCPQCNVLCCCACHQTGSGEPTDRAG